MERVDEIIPADQVVVGGGEEKDNTGVNEETMALTVFVPEEPELTVVATEEEQQQEALTGEVTVAKRPRGRPKKVVELIQFSLKRGRGRPKGSGKLQRMKQHSFFGDANGGSSFNPHIMLVQRGENIVKKIRAFSESTPDSVCILSACGTVSIADIYASLPRPGVLRYEGEFNIVTLNGSHTYTNKWAPKFFALSVQLAYPDGRLCGGAVAGSLIAATPTQIMMGTFKQDLRQQYSTSSDVTVAATAGACSPVQGMRLIAVAEPVGDGGRINLDKSPVAYPEANFQQKKMFF